MKNSMQTRQGKEGHIWPVGPISLPGTGTQRQRDKVGKRKTKVELGISRRGTTGHQEKGIIHLVYGP